MMSTVMHTVNGVQLDSAQRHQRISLHMQTIAIEIISQLIHNQSTCLFLFTKHPEVNNNYITYHYKGHFVVESLYILINSFRKFPCLL